MEDFSDAQSIAAVPYTTGEDSYFYTDAAAFSNVLRDLVSPG